MAGNLSYCPLCKRRRKTAYWNYDEEKNIWMHCCACNATYTLAALTKRVGIKVAMKYLDRIKNNIIQPSDTASDSLQRIAWPADYISINSTIAKEGQDYILSRGLSLEGQLYYDKEINGIVFPLYYQGVFCGAQTRLIVPWIKEDGKPQKMTTLEGTKKSLLFYNWDQNPFPRLYKGIIVTEGAFDTLAIEQALNALYGPITNPFKTIATMGSGVSEYQVSVLNGLKEAGYKVILAPDFDPAGFIMFDKSKKAITHVMTTDEKGKDWNMLLKEMGHVEFAKYILTKIKPV